MPTTMVDTKTRTWRRRVDVLELDVVALGYVIKICRCMKQKSLMEGVYFHRN